MIEDTGDAPSPPRLHSTKVTCDAPPLPPGSIALRIQVMLPLSPQAPRIQVLNVVDGFVIIQSLDLAWLNKI